VIATPAPGTSAKDASRRPLLYAAIALVAAAGVYALSRREAVPTDAAPIAADDVQSASEQVAAPEPAAPMPAAVPTPVAPAPATGADVQAAVPTSIAPVEPRYVLEVVSNPEGARVTAGAQRVVAPAQIDLGTLSSPVSLRAEMDGYVPTGTTVDRVGFMLDDGAMRRRIVLRLNESPVAKPQPQREARGKPRRERVAQADSQQNPPASGAAPGVQEKTEPPRPTPPIVSVTPAAPTVPAPVPATQPTPGLVAAPNQADTAKPVEKERPIDAAMQCLAIGDNACVLKALEGRARSAQELELLIETYRTTGNPTKAEKYMQVYVDKHPDERRAVAYRRLLENRQAEASSP
jgi:hypothetical protein